LRETLTDVEKGTLRARTVLSKGLGKIPEQGRREVVDLWGKNPLVQGWRLGKRGPKKKAIEEYTIST